MFFKSNMFSNHRVIFFKFQFFGGLAWVFCRHIIKTSVSRADQFYANCCWFCHWLTLQQSPTLVKREN